jgi:hypothetical protein
VNGTAYQSSNSFAGLAPVLYNETLLTQVAWPCRDLLQLLIQYLLLRCSDNCECYSANMCCAIWKY